MKFSKQKSNDYGTICYSESFILNPKKLYIPTKKFNKTTTGVVLDYELLTLLRDNGIKYYIKNSDENELLVYIDNNEIELPPDSFKVCIKQFTNLNGEICCKLIASRF